MARVPMHAPAIPAQRTIQRSPHGAVATRLAEAIADVLDHARRQTHAISLAHWTVRMVDPLAVHVVARGATYVLVARVSASVARSARRAAVAKG